MHLAHDRPAGEGQEASHSDAPGHRLRPRLGARRVRVWALGLSLLTMLVAGCSVQLKDSSAPYFPTSPPAESLAPLPVTAALSEGARNSVIGPVSQPNPSLTPGAVASTDVAAICASPSHVTVTIPAAEEAAVYAAYNLPYPPDPSKYALDELVPLTLGGANVEGNLWPASMRPIGFHEKQQLNAKLRTLVCEGVLPLNLVQQDLMSNWYLLWLRYGD